MNFFDIGDENPKIMDYSQNTAYMQKLFEHRLSARRNCGLFAKITMFFIAIFNRYFRLPETIKQCKHALFILLLWEKLF